MAAAVFDCDGLLVDSESIWLDMLTHWLDENKVSATAEEFLGLSVDDTAAQLAGHIHGAQEPSSIAESLTRRYSTLLSTGVHPMPGAVRLFSALAQEVPVAVASNGLRNDVTTMLEDSGLLRLARTVWTVEDVPAGKPAPDLYQQACAHLGAAPEQSVAFEDSPAGARAALDAGMVVIGVNADPTVDLPCTYRVESLDRVELKEPHV